MSHATIRHRPDQEPRRIHVVPREILPSRPPRRDIRQRPHVVSSPLLFPARPTVAHPPTQQRTAVTVAPDTALQRAIAASLRTAARRTAPGVPCETLSRLRRGTVKRRTSKSCTICMEPYSAGHTIVQLPCRHYFHDHCASHWLRGNVFCPLCRTVVSH